MTDPKKTKKKDENFVPIEKRTLWVRWDRIVNMTAADVRAFRTSEAGHEVGWETEDAKKESISGIAGHEASKMIEKMITKAVKYRGQAKRVPNWTPEEWALAQTQISYISRARSNVGELKDENDEPTPKAKAPMLWGRNELKAVGKFPDKDEIKKELTNKFYESVNQLLDYLD